MQNTHRSYLNGTSKTDAPEINEIEISVFGPGYGENILLHIGNENWLLIDSCVDPVNKEPSPIKYLRNIGIDPSKAVKLIVASHWHDDHVRGLAEIIRQCSSAEFVVSNALRTKEFLTLVYALGKRSMMETSGVQEFYEILEILKERVQSKHGNTELLKYAISDRLIWRSSTSSSASHLSCEVHSLSPSDESTTIGVKNIGGLLPVKGQLKTRALAMTPNHAAVVLWIKVGSMYILLGSDLEETDNPKTGWSIIVDSTTRPQEKAVFFKISHHGSKNGDYQPVWDRMLVPNPLVGLTPFIRGNLILPKKSDVTRICQRTPNAYSTAFPKQKRLKHKDKVVEKTIRETVKEIREIIPSTGHIRLRSKDIGPPINWKIDLFGDAIPLEEFYKK
ncbi:MAG: MBL fold metallo-hydrolase [Deltaproteobacteria bacterium]|nr:MBL fold metallo-hydrolase [Deltaproteobacteria bacterium]